MVLVVVANCKWMQPQPFLITEHHAEIFFCALWFLVCFEVSEKLATEMATPSQQPCSCHCLISLTYPQVVSDADIRSLANKVCHCLDISFCIQVVLIFVLKDVAAALNSQVQGSVL